VLIYLQKFNQKNEEDETATIPTNEEGCITFLYIPRIFKSWAPGPSPLILYLQRWAPDISPFLLFVNYMIKGRTSLLVIFV
jgi:hypothetical protein